MSTLQIPDFKTDNKELKTVEIFTDGACTGNPGPGGYGVILVHGEKRRELSGGFRRTTNNRMELLAAIMGLKELRYPCAVTVYTDSQYLAKGISEGWAKRWKANGWVLSNKKPTVNVDLWSALLDLCETHDVVFKWVKGHAGHPENERCDQLSVLAASQPNLPEDTEYINHSK